MKYEISLIQKAVSEAIAHARQFASVDDGGTCNFDACVIYTPGIHKATAEQIGGTHLMDTRWHGRHLHLQGTEGQANRRTTMAEAQSAYLKEHYPKLHVGMYYQMD